MKQWLRRIRGVIGMGLTWALAWGIVGGGLMEAVVDPRGEILDMWPQTLAIPGLITGMLFAGMLALMPGRRRIDDLSMRRVALWGATAGAALAALALAAGALPAVPLLLRAGVIVLPMVGLSAASAAGTLLIARRAARAERLPPGQPEALISRTTDPERSALPPRMP